MLSNIYIYIYIYKVNWIQQNVCRKRMKTEEWYMFGNSFIVPTHFDFFNNITISRKNNSALFFPRDGDILKKVETYWRNKRITKYISFFRFHPFLHTYMYIFQQLSKRTMNLAIQVQTLVEAVFVHFVFLCLRSTCGSWHSVSELLSKKDKLMTLLESIFFSQQLLAKQGWLGCSGLV